MFRAEGTWVHAESEQFLRDRTKSRVRKIYWKQPGWYFLTEYSQPCPRGCCRDDVMEYVHIDDRREEIVEQMKELSGQLKDIYQRKKE